MIIENKKEKIVFFKSLSNGTIFKSSGLYYLKTEESEEDYSNAVDLKSGSRQVFENYDEVVSVNVKIIIED